MDKKRDRELSHAMAEDASRGRRQPARAVSLENQRRIKRAAERLADSNCDRREYLNLLRDDFGLKAGSGEFLNFVKVWESFVLSFATINFLGQNPILPSS